MKGAKLGKYYQSLFICSLSKKNNFSCFMITDCKL